MKVKIELRNLNLYNCLKQRLLSYSKYIERGSRHEEYCYKEIILNNMHLMLNKSLNFMQLCQLCKMTSQNPIQLICSHSLCLKFQLKIQIQEKTSQIQYKFRIQCPKCDKMTHLMILKIYYQKAMNYIQQLIVVKWRQKYQMNQFSLMNNQQEAIFVRRESNVYQISEVFSKNSQMLNVQAINNNPQNAFNHNQFKKKKPNIGNEKISNTLILEPVQQNHQKKQSYQMPHQDIAIECKAKTQIVKLNDFLIPNSNNPVATTLSFQLLFQQTDNKKTIAQAVQQYKQKQKTQNINIYVQEHQQNTTISNQSDIIFAHQIIKKHLKQFGECLSSIVSIIEQYI